MAASRLWNHSNDESVGIERVQEGVRRAQSGRLAS